MLQDLAAVSRRLLVIDPCEECERLLPCLQASGWMVRSCNLGEVGEAQCDVGVIRLRASHLHHPEALKQLISQSGTEWIAVLSSDALQHAEVGNFIGEWCFDYHTLPFDVERFDVTLGRAFGMARLRGKGSADETGYERQLLGPSRSMRELRRQLEGLAPSLMPVLIRGESGTGKELVAQTLHRLSPRSDGAFVVVNCGAIPERLLLTRLFGAGPGESPHALGSIEAANGGTLFLDEIGDLSLELQRRLFHVLQSRRIDHPGSSTPVAVDVRMLAATHVDLQVVVEQGRFRHDLYRQLSTQQVQTTPLRERTVDIRCLAEHFARRYAAEISRRPRGFSQSALRVMIDHSWPGNVRELANRVRRGVALAEGRQIEAQDLGLELGEPSQPLFGTLEDYICRAELQALNDALRHYSNNMSQAARVLGVSRPTFYRLLHKHHIR